PDADPLALRLLEERRAGGSVGSAHQHELPRSAFVAVLTGELGWDRGEQLAGERPAAAEPVLELVEARERDRRGRLGELGVDPMRARHLMVLVEAEVRDRRHLTGELFVATEDGAPFAGGQWLQRMEGDDLGVALRPDRHAV